MADVTGGNVNVSDQAVTLDPIPVGSALAVDIVPAAVELEQPWRRVSIFNDGNRILWLRFYGREVDDDKKGEAILPGQPLVIELPNMPSAAWSVIFAGGGTQNVYVQYF